MSKYTKKQYYQLNKFLPGVQKEFLDLTDENITDEKINFYNLNSLGYRCPEFNTVNISESVFVFGCSNVFGIELEEKDTISYNLEKLLNRPVINMGIPASSIEFALFNQIQLSQMEKPFAVVNLWTSTNRISYLHDNHVNHIGPWSSKSGHFSGKHDALLFSIWNEDLNNSKIHSIFCKKTAEALWKDIIHIQGSVFYDTAKDLEIEYFKPIDHSDKSGHPGPISTKQFAKIIANQIFSLDNNS